MFLRTVGINSLGRAGGWFSFKLSYKFENQNMKQKYEKKKKK